MPIGNAKDVIQVPRLEPKDLYDRRVRRDHARLRAYNTLLEQIYHRVYATSQLSGNTSSVLYSVPPFILGLPKLDMEDCIVYLVWQLRQSGFEVKFTWPNFLYISWRHHEGAYLANKNPIMQAMMPEPTVTVLGNGTGAPSSSGKGGSQKKKGGQAAAPSRSVAFNDEIELLTKQHTASAPAAPAPSQNRRAMDYEPPASFIQNMDRPVSAAATGTRGGMYKEGVAKGNVLADLWTM